MSTCAFDRGTPKDAVPGAGARARDEIHEQRADDRIARRHKSVLCRQDTDRDGTHQSAQSGVVSNGDYGSERDADVRVGVRRLRAAKTTLSSCRHLRAARMLTILDSFGITAPVLPLNWRPSDVYMARKEESMVGPASA